MISVGIDASRNKSGGAVAHIIGLLSSANPVDFGIEVVHLWSYSSLHEKIPDYPWLVKHTHKQLDNSIVHQILWQYLTLPRLVKKAECDILLSTDAGTLCPFQPSIVMSRDMLSFEKGEMERYNFFSFQRLRLFLLKYIQIRSLKNAKAAIFLTNYAASIIQPYTKNGNYKIINHGISDKFRATVKYSQTNKNEFSIIYVSNADLYKHQWHVIEAVSLLRKKGLNVSLKLVGAGSGIASNLVFDAINKYDENGEYIQVYDFMPHEKISTFLKESDVFLFASSCENMPNTLIEGMASGLPIICSNRGPMPEVLGDCGLYFDPEQPKQIAAAIESMIISPEKMKYFAQRSKLRSETFSWDKCAIETWTYLVETVTKKNATLDK